MAHLEDSEIRTRMLSGDVSLGELLSYIKSLTKSGVFVPHEIEEKALVMALSVDGDRKDLKERLDKLQRLMGKDVNNSKQIIETAKKHYAVGRSLPSPGTPEHDGRWLVFRNRIRKAIESFETPQEALHYAQTKINFEHRGSMQREGYLLKQYEHALASEFSLYDKTAKDFSDPDGSAPGTSAWFNGRPVSNVTYYIARIILSCLSLIPTPKTIVEIGGGYGAPARAWLKNPIARPDLYILVDLEESLFFAETLLIREFGEDAVKYILDVEDAKGIGQQTRVLLCPITCVGALHTLNIDLVINSGSLQEMSTEWVQYYMDLLDELTPRHFYSLNYFGQPIDALEESFNMCSAWPSPSWKAVLLRANPALLRMQSQRHFLEALYEYAENDASEDGVQHILSHYEERRLTLEILAELLDIYRVSGLHSIGLRILDRINKEMPHTPKEALWLVDKLLPTSPPEDIERLEKMRSQFNALRKTDSEGIC